MDTTDVVITAIPLWGEVAVCFVGAIIAFLAVFFMDHLTGRHRDDFDR